MEVDDLWMGNYFVHVLNTVPNGDDWSASGPTNSPARLLETPPKSRLEIRISRELAAASPHDNSRLIARCCQNVGQRAAVRLYVSSKQLILL